MHTNSIENAKITSTSISMADHGCLTIWITVEGDGWGVNVGGYVDGKGYLGAKHFEGNGAAIVKIMKIMDVVGVDKWEDLEGKYVRVKLRGYGETVDEIGNILEDRWINFRDFYKDNDSKAVYIWDEEDRKV